MHVVRFTKFWAGLSVESLGERAAALGYDGLDLAVRAGHAITPGNVAHRLPGAVRLWESLGIRCSMISAETSLVDADAEEARALFRAAGAAGVPRIKIGYFQYVPGSEFDATWAHARRRIAGFERLARETGVQAVCHTHGGPVLGSTCAGLRHLLEETEPAWVGAYPDLGHLAVGGEDVRMGLAMLRDRLAAVAAKDARHAPDPRPERPAAWGEAFVPLGEGAARVGEALATLRAQGFDGPFSVHTEYTADPQVIATVGGRDDTPQAEALRRRGEVEDLRYLRDLWRRPS